MHAWRSASPCPAASPPGCSLHTTLTTRAALGIWPVCEQRRIDGHAGWGHVLSSNARRASDMSVSISTNRTYIMSCAVSPRSTQSASDSPPTTTTTATTATTSRDVAQPERSHRVPQHSNHMLPATRIRTASEPPHDDNGHRIQGS